MKSRSIGFTLALALLAAPSSSWAAPVAPREAPKIAGARTKDESTNTTIKPRGLKQTGIVATVGIDVGVPMGGAGSDHGIVVTPRDPETGKRKIAGFSTINGSLGPFGGKGVLATRRDMTGYEVNAGPVSRNNPIYGDRVSIPIVPGMLSVSASRKGGLGVSFSGIPIPGLPYPLVRGGASLYVTDPRLEKVSTPLLNGVDKVVSKVKRTFKHKPPLSLGLSDAAKPATDAVAGQSGEAHASAPEPSTSK